MGVLLVIWRRAARAADRLATKIVAAARGFKGWIPHPTCVAPRVPLYVLNRKARPTSASVVLARKLTTPPAEHLARQERNRPKVNVGIVEGLIERPEWEERVSGKNAFFLPSAMTLR